MLLLLLLQSHSRFVLLYLLVCDSVSTMPCQDQKLFRSQIFFVCRSLSSVSPSMRIGVFARECMLYERYVCVCVWFSESLCLFETNLTSETPTWTSFLRKYSYRDIHIRNNVYCARSCIMIASFYEDWFRISCVCMCPLCVCFSYEELAVE